MSNEELSKISSTEEINERISALDQCLNVTNQGLFLDVMDNYDTFLTGLENIQNINILLEQSKVLANESKDSIQAMQNELKLRYLRVIYLRKRQIRLQGLIQELKNLIQTRYFEVHNLPNDLNGNKPYFDMATGRIFYYDAIQQRFIAKSDFLTSFRAWL